MPPKPTSPDSWRNDPTKCFIRGAVMAFLLSNLVWVGMVLLVWR